MKGIHRWPVAWKMSPFDDVFMPIPYRDGDDFAGDDMESISLCLFRLSQNPDIEVQFTPYSFDWNNALFPGNGTVPNRCQAITWTIYHSVHWRICDSQDFNGGLLNVLTVRSNWIPFSLINNTFKSALHPDPGPFGPRWAPCWPREPRYQCG